MSELSTYSIETDHTVLLAFKDGRKLRVPTAQLAHYLAEHDLQKVRAAIKLRRDFIQRHMPKVALLVAATGLIGLLTVGGRAVAQLISPPRPVPVTPDNTEVVRNQLPVPSVASPVPSPAAKGAPVVAAAPTVHRASATKPHPHVATQPAPRPLLPPVVIDLSLPVASILPDPVAGSDQSVPAPLPTPTVPNQNGEVLGDSVTPTTTPTPDPSPLVN